MGQHFGKKKIINFFFIITKKCPLMGQFFLSTKVDDNSNISITKSQRESNDVLKKEISLHVPLRLAYEPTTSNHCRIRGLGTTKLATLSTFFIFYPQIEGH